MSSYQTTYVQVGQKFSIADVRRSKDTASNFSIRKLYNCVMFKVLMEDDLVCCALTNQTITQLNQLEAQLFNCSRFKTDLELYSQLIR